MMSASADRHGQQAEPVPPRIFVMLAAGMAMFAFAPILVRAAGDTDPFAFAAIRTVVAALILLPFWLIRKNRTESFFGRKDNLIALLAGAILGCHFIFWILAVQNTSIASASILVTIHPVILIILEAGLFKRVFPPAVWVGVFGAFSGSILLGYSDAQAGGLFEHALLGDMYALAAALLFALYFLISQRLRQKSNWINYVIRVYGATGATCLVVALIYGSDFRLEPVVWLAAIGLAIGPQIIGHGSMNYSVKYVAPTMLSTLILSEPVFATILAGLIFAEFPPILTYVAMFVILTGILLAWSTKRKI